MDLHELLENPKTWVVIAFVVFIAVVFKKAKHLLVTRLDARSSAIASELKRAQDLREEAEGVLALYKKKHAEYTKEAKEILQKAREDADLMAAHADAELKTALDARLQSALEGIAQEEARAIAEVREHVVNIALTAARDIILQHIDKTPQQDLLKVALADIDRKIH